MAKILITGGTGYIGSHTVVSLIEQGYEAIIIDNLCNSSIESLDGVEAITGIRPLFEQIDMQNRASLDDFFYRHADIKAVIHFAALKAVGESVEKPVEYYRNNLGSLLNLVASMQKFSVGNLIFSSSATVYGEPDSLPIMEFHPVKPAMSPYGNTKKICEDIISDTARVNKEFHAISLRYFNPIGAHESGFIGELPQGVPNNLMPFITQTAAGIRKELKVFGDDYDTPDGTAVRDYIHVVDLANAHVKALDRLMKENQDDNYEVFNLGTGNGFSVLEVIKSFEKTSGLKLPYQIVDRRSGDVEATYASTTLANEKLNWKAERTLDEMTYSSWNWEKKARKMD
ncbi:MAG: UDP-glucose 4-epimerase GalE [Bacteroidetes bacterium]|nr:MAG: UDP-glucose 4-epimerase GalE [Bacteroidota bacterium]